MSRLCPRLVLAGERGGSGKTILSIGLLAAWRKQGKPCAPFKKGPDYIDSAWLAAASGRPCRNLDTFLMGEETVIRSFREHAIEDGVNLLEGNRGLFDGMNPEGSYSTAELAKLLDCPVILAIDCKKRTRTSAALALGCRLLDKEVNLAGVVLNRLATARQERVTRTAVERDAGLPVLGAVPRLPGLGFRERRLGLVPPQEDERPRRAIGEMAAAAEKYLDLDRIRDLAFGAPPLLDSLSAGAAESARTDERRLETAEKLRIGYFYDSAFHFYYPENLEALEREGAELIPIDVLRSQTLPANLDGLYIGGGFPEERAAALAANATMRESVREEAGKGLPVYAECGGLMYLGRWIETEGVRHEMAGVFPVSFVMERLPRGHGYVEAKTTGANPFFAGGANVKGHEFHYSRPVEWKEEDLTFGLALERGNGFDGGWDGLVYRNTFATYVHTHALGEPKWAPALVKRCRQFNRRFEKESGFSAEG